MLPLADKHMFLMTATWPDHDSGLNPMAEDRIIRIKELEYLDRTLGSGVRHWRVHVSISSYACTSVVTLLDPFDEDSEDGLAWALEQYPTRQPFESHRARSVTKSLTTYGRKLLEQLGLSEILTNPGALASPSGKNVKDGKDSAKHKEKDATPKAWILDVEALEAQGRFHSLHWEALENPQIWTANTRPGSRLQKLIIRRKITINQLSIQNSTITIKSDVFRILLVVTHSMSAGIADGTSGNPRLVAGPLMELVLKLTKERKGASPVHLEIVRPGTWGALVDHLEKRGRGWFHLVHFDVHAKFDHEAQDTSIAFLSESSAKKRVWRSGAEVSILLAQFSIKLVVLNCPRSSTAKGICPISLAERMIRDGARAVVALPYKLLNDGSEILMTTFYRHLLSKNWDISHALTVARNAMFAFQLREGRFGMRVDIADWVVPVLYHNSGTEVELLGDDEDKLFLGKIKNPKAKSAISEFLHALGETTSNHGRSQSHQGLRKRSKSSEDLVIGEVIPGNEMLGRDGDIFELETRFLMENNVIRLQGVPGAGKTTLARHLCWWWKSTSLVVDSFYFCFYRKPLFNVEMLLRELYLQFFLPKSGTQNRSPLHPIQPVILDSRCLPVGGHHSSTTSLDSASGGLGEQIFPDNWMDLTVRSLKEIPYLLVLDSLESSEAMKEKRIRNQWISFLEKVEGGKSLVLVVGNRDDPWINGSTLKMGEYEIRSLEAKKATMLGEDILVRHGGSLEKFRAQRSRQYLEKILMLFDRNPVVMELALPHIAKWESSLDTIFTDLLQGSTSLDSSRAANVYAAKSLKMLTTLFQDLDPLSKRLLLSFSPFWTVIMKDVDLYLMCLVFHGVIQLDGVEINRAISDLWNVNTENRMAKLKKLLSDSGLAAKFVGLVHQLLTLGLLSYEPRAIDPSQREMFYGIHPLLTIFLRQTLDIEHDEIDTTQLIDEAALKRAFLDYYTQRSVTWTHNPDEASIIAAKELKNEETNFLSAIAIPLQYGSAEKCFFTFPSQVFVRLSAMCQVDRQLQHTTALIAHFCEKIIERIEELRQRRGTRRIGEIPVAIALFAAEWLCTYHAENSGPEAFKAVVGMSLKLASLADENAESTPTKQLQFIEASCAQKAWAASDCLVDGLRIRRPFNGLISTYSETSMNGASTTLDWTQLAAQYLRLHSLGVQASLSSFFKLAIRQALRKDLKVLWKGALRSLRSTPLVPLTALYTWVSPLLSRTDPLEAAFTPKISSTRFTGYHEFIRSQVFLLFRDSASAKRQLLSGLEHAREKSDRDGEKLCHLRLSDLSYRSRTFAECIAHAEFIRDIQINQSFPERADHVCFAYLVLREALCQKHISAYESTVAAFSTVRELARFTDEKQLEYIALRKLAGMKQEHPLIGHETVTELLLSALDIAYSPVGPYTPAVAADPERGVLLRRILYAAQSGKAGESMKDVLSRIAERRGVGLEEVRRFLDKVIEREREVVRERSMEGGKGAGRVESDVAMIWREAEGRMWRLKVGEWETRWDAKGVNGRKEGWEVEVKRPWMRTPRGSPGGSPSVSMVNLGVVAAGGRVGMGV